MNSPIIFPAPKIKEEDNLSDIIDLDGDKTPEDLVYEWDTKVRLKIKNYFIVDSEQSLDTLMKWYIQSVRDEVVHFDDFPVLRVLVAKHIQFFKLYFLELNTCFVDNYLDNMEDILTFYSNIEVKSLPSKGKDGNKHTHKKLLLSTCQKIVSMLTLYLLNREDRVYHVVMKIKLNSLSEDSKKLLNLIYRKLLTEDPSDKSDLGFCRAYILYQKWKMVRKPEDWEEMDKIMYKLYHRSAESVKMNEVLSQILLPQNNSILDVLIHISAKHVTITEKYFEYLKSKKSEEDSLLLPELSNIEINDEILPDLMDNSEDGDFDRAYQNFVNSMSTLSQENGNLISDDCVTVKIEDEDDDDCQIVAVSSLGYESESTELVHEILEDDDDIEIIYFKKKEQQNMLQKDKEKSGLSFLDSIDILDASDVPSEKVSSSSCAIVLPPKLTRNMVTTSTNTSLDSPKHNSSAQESAVQIGNSSISTSNAQERTKTDADYQRSSVTTSVANLEIDTECVSSASKNPADMETSSEALAMHHSVQIRSVINIQTQTDNIAESDNCLDNDKEITKLHTSEKVVDGGNIMSPYCLSYGLITPPSDQLLDEPVAPIESNMYPNVYANIVRTRNGSRETDSIKHYYTKSIPNSCEMNAANDLISPLGEQSCNNVENQPTLCQDVGSDMEFEPSIEANAKKKQDIFDGHVGFNQCDSDAETLDVTEEKNTDETDLNQNTSRSSNKSLASHDHAPNFNSKNCSIQKIVVGNLPNALSASTDSNSLCRSPDTYSDIFKTPIASANSPCTSTDVGALQNYSKLDSIHLSNDQKEIRSVSCPSPDITSTSTDIQDSHENFPGQEGDSEENRVEYDNFCYDDLETEDILITENQCSERYIEYSESNTENENRKNNENVSQSNLDDGEGGEEIFIEDTIAISNEKELSYIIEGTLPIEVNGNVCLDSQSNESSIHSDLSNDDNNGEGNEIIQSEMINQVKMVNGDSTPHKELRVDIEILDSSKRNMFHSPDKSSDEFSKFQENFPWDKLNDLDEILTGPVFNGISSSISPNTDVDPFYSKPSSNSRTISPQTPLNSSANSSGEVVSPDYEEITDFKIFYEERKNSNKLGSSSVQNKLKPVGDESCTSTTSLGDGDLQHHKDRVKVTVKIFPKTLKSLQNGDVNINKSTSIDLNCKDSALKTKGPKNGKRNHVSFTKDLINKSNTVSHSPTDKTRDVLQSILKKSSSDAEICQYDGKRTKLESPKPVIVRESLEYYKIKPDDDKLFRDAIRIVIRKEDCISNFDEWKRKADVTRIVNEKKQRAQSASQQITYQVDYQNNELKVVTPQGKTSTMPIDELKHRKSNAILQSNSSGLDKGMLANTPNTNINDNDDTTPSSPYQYSLLDGLANLDVSRIELELNLNDNCCKFPNPNTPKEKCQSQEFISAQNNRHSCPGIDCTESFDFKCKDETRLDLNLSNVPNNSNLNLNQQPTIIQQGEESEKTNQEMGEAPLLPTNSYLHMKTLSPKPIINSSSPPSISLTHAFQTNPYQIESCTNIEDQPTLCNDVGSDMEFELSIEPNAKKEEDIFDKNINSILVSLNQCDSDAGTLDESVLNNNDKSDSNLKSLSPSRDLPKPNNPKENCQSPEFILAQNNRHNYAHIGNLIKSDAACGSNKMINSTESFDFKFKDQTGLDLIQNNFPDKVNLNLNHQPTIIQQGEESEKTNQEMEEAPLLLTNSYLNLRILPSRPIINSSSSPSISLSRAFQTNPYQIESCTNVEDQPTLCKDVVSDMEFEPSIEPNAKKEEDIFDKNIDSTLVGLNQCESDAGILDEFILNNNDKSDSNLKSLFPNRNVPKPNNPKENCQSQEYILAQNNRHNHAHIGYLIKPDAACSSDRTIDSTESFDFKCKDQTGLDLIQSNFPIKVNLNQQPTITQQGEESVETNQEMGEVPLLLTSSYLNMRILPPRLIINSSSFPSISLSHAFQTNPYQIESCTNVENQPTLCKDVVSDTEFEPSIEPNAKKKEDIFDKNVNSILVGLNQGDSDVGTLDESVLNNNDKSDSILKSLSPNRNVPKLNNPKENCQSQEYILAQNNRRNRAHIGKKPDAACSSNKTINSTESFNFKCKDQTRSDLIRSNFPNKVNLSLNQQPTITQQGEDSEKTNQEMGEAALLPTNSYLNMRRLYSRPVINSSSPPSISLNHIFQTNPYQIESCTNVEDQPSLCKDVGSDMEFEPSIESNAKKKEDIFVKNVDSRLVSLNRCDSDAGTLDELILNNNCKSDPNLKSLPPNRDLPKSNNPKENCRSQKCILPQNNRHNYADIANLIKPDAACGTDSTESLTQSASYFTYCSPPSISPSHTSQKNTCEIESAPLLPVPEDFESKSHLYDDNAMCIDPSNGVGVSVKSKELLNSEGVKFEMLTKLDFSETEPKPCLPLKKRKLPDEMIDDSYNVGADQSKVFIKRVRSEEVDDYIHPDQAEDDNYNVGADEVKEIIKGARSYIDSDQAEEFLKRAMREEVKEAKEEVLSYPAKPMISIAEIHEKFAESHPRVFKTPAERKEMPPPLASIYPNPSESPRIVTEQYNNHTYNNPTINYHMNNVPCSFFPCPNLPYFPSIIVPVNSKTTIDLVTPQQQSTQQYTTEQAPVGRPKRENRRRRRKEKT